MMLALIKTPGSLLRYTLLIQESYNYDNQTFGALFNINIGEAPVHIYF